MQRTPLRLIERVVLLFLELVVLVALAACGSGPVAQAPASGATPPEMPTPTEPNVARTVVHFMTRDLVRLDGWLYQDGARTAIICAHGLAGDKSAWVDIAPWLAAGGPMVLAFDFRGDGDSGGKYDANKLDLDMLAAIAFVKSRGAQKVILLGSSLGAKVALRVASYTPVAGLIGLSPGFSNLDPSRGDFTLSRDIPRAITAPKLFIDTQGDIFASEMQQMYQEARPPKEMHLYPGTEHGTVMFYAEYGHDLIERILAFVGTYAPLR